MRCVYHALLYGAAQTHLEFNVVPDAAIAGDGVAERLAKPAASTRRLPAVGLLAPRLALTRDNR